MEKLKVFRPELWILNIVKKQAVTASPLNNNAVHSNSLNIWCFSVTKSAQPTVCKIFWSEHILLSQWQIYGHFNFIIVLSFYFIDNQVKNNSK